MTDYLVTMESAWVVRDVRTVDDAVGIAIGEAGILIRGGEILEKAERPTAKYVEIEAGQSGCPYCEESLNCGLVVANTGLVGLVLEMKVFRAETAEHAERIAKSVVGKALGDVPLKILETTVIGESKAEPAAPARPAPSDRPAGQARPTGRDGPRPPGRRPFKR